MKEGFRAQLVSVNERFYKDDRDVAIIKIEEKNLPAIPLADSSTLVVGRRAFIFGFPASAELERSSLLEATFTTGVVSAIKQSESQEFRIFQTDAKVSQGSSGGPLLNDRGEAVGIVTFQTGASDRETGDNFAFALPIELVKDAAAAVGTPLAPGAYFAPFSEGLVRLQESRCERANQKFEEAKQSANPVFGVANTIQLYQEVCTRLISENRSIDSNWQEFRSRLQSVNGAFLYLAGLMLLLFALSGSAIFWLFRRLRREEAHIHRLAKRLKKDEAELSGYRKLLSRFRMRPHVTPEDTDLTNPPKRPMV